MNHQLEQRRQDAAAPTHDRDLDPVVPEPGQVSRSSLLHRPELAMGMGLGRGAAPGARPMPAARFAARAQPGQSQAGTRELLEQVSSIVTAAGSGAPLPGEVSARMKAELGGAGPAAARAIDQVRIHADDAAAQAAHLLGAQAFALGHHVYFGRDQFAPGTEQGDRLLRHELTHVVQHARGELSAHGALELVAESSSVEAEARAAEAKPASSGDPPRAPGAAMADKAGAPRPGAAMADKAGAPGPRAAMADKTATPTAAAGAAPTAEPAPAAAPAALAPIARAPAPGAQPGATGASPQGTAQPARAAAAPGMVDLLGKSAFEPSAAIAAAIEQAGPGGADVKVTLGKLTAPGVIRVKKVNGGYVTDESSPQVVPLSHPLFTVTKGLQPVLRVRIGAAAPGAISGFVTTASAPGEQSALQKALADQPEILGLRGFSMPTLAITNHLEAGALTVGTQQAIPFVLGGWVNGQLSFGLSNSSVTFDAHASIRARGLQDGELTLSRDARGGIKGSVSLGVALGDKFTGNATATYDKGDVAIKGQLGYHSEKLNGKLGIVVADANEAEQLVRQQIDPGALAPTAGPEGGAPARAGKRAIAGWGDLDFAFTDWMTGKAKVVYGPSGHITVIGKIAPPKRVDLMDSSKSFKQPILPEVKIEAKYGIPYVADVHIGVGIGLSATAGLGPIYMTDLALEGVYSTDPAVLNRFSITGALRAQADAALELTVRGYAGLTLLGHSVNAGVQIVGKAGLRAYAEARPTLGYRETASPRAGKKGEYYLKGHLEMAAQPVLSLGGSLFVELDSPAWSPAGDHKWQWPIGSLEYPIPAQMGIGADIDYVIGSGKWPELKLTKPSFDPSKFVDTMMANRLPAKSGRDKQEKAGKFDGIKPTGPTQSPPSVPKTKPADPDLSSRTPPKTQTGPQTPEQQKNVPANPQISQQWAAGMKALADLRKRAEKDSEDETEIKTHLAQIKAAHGFTDLTARREGALWIVSAAMNPSTVNAAQIPAAPKTTEKEKKKSGKQQTTAASDKQTTAKNKVEVNDKSNGRGKLTSKDKSSNLREHQVIFGPLVNGCGHYVIARISQADEITGNSVAGARPLWWSEMMRPDQGTDKTDTAWVQRYVVQGHLLNKGLGGPNDMRNLTPITKKANSQHYHEVEKAAKALVDKGYIIHYKVKANYDSPASSASFHNKIAAKYLANFPSQLECKLSVLNELENEKPPAPIVKTVKNEME